MCTVSLCETRINIAPPCDSIVLPSALAASSPSLIAPRASITATSAPLARNRCSSPSGRRAATTRHPPPAAAAVTSSRWRKDSTNTGFSAAAASAAVRVRISSITPSIAGSFGSRHAEGCLPACKALPPSHGQRLHFVRQQHGGPPRPRDQLSAHLGHRSLRSALPLLHGRRDD